MRITVESNLLAAIRELINVNGDDTYIQTTYNTVLNSVL